VAVAVQMNQVWVFATALDGSLYPAVAHGGSTPTWHSHGKPAPAVNAVLAPTAITYLPPMRGANSRVYVFERGSNGRLRELHGWSHLEVGEPGYTAGYHSRLGDVGP
jgi:hypothetical protein